MDFWSTVAGHNLAEALKVFCYKYVNKEQYTNVIKQENVGKYIEAEIAAGHLFVSAMPYDEENTLVIMEK